MSNKTEKLKLTPAQGKAIYTSGGGITVSAAAGSGKTWVLVQRVIRLLTGENAVPADRLLILTFTNLAAGEMRSRISKAIDELIEQEPENDFYRRQQLLLASADICTIDSFCSKVVRDNFFRLGVSRDYRIGTTSELYELRRKIMSGLIEKYYLPPEEGSEDAEVQAERKKSFDTLSMLMTAEKLDSDLENELLELYNKYTSHAFPEQWMEDCVAAYEPSLMLEDSKAGQFIIRQLRSWSKVLRNYYDQAMTHYDAIHETQQEKKKKAKDGKKNSYDNTIEMLEGYGAFLVELEKALSEEKTALDNILQWISQFQKITIRYGASKDKELITAVKLSGKFAAVVTEKLGPYAEFNNTIFHQNNEQLYPVMKCLSHLLKEFDESFFAAKKERGILDFHDLEGLVLKLLYQYDETSGTYQRSDFAKEMAEKYHEIMIDEYQDTNDIQENIFRALSRNDENLFVVGDIKQSIYRFREAKPLLFKERCQRGILFREDQAEAAFPALIVLDRNFRSRKGIIDSVNYIFRLLMSEQSGEIEYDDTQSLSVGADYPEPDKATTELHIIEYKKADADADEDQESDEEDADRIRTEAAYCADLIRSMIDHGEEVYDNKADQKRPAIYSDFCIMIRTAKNKANVYADELEKVGVPSYADAEFDLLDRYEVKAAISYLNILSNPLSDIDMTASLMCPVFGFTPDDLAVMKGIDEKYYYNRLLYFQTETARNQYPTLSQKAERFISLMQSLRQLAVTAPTDRVLQEFFERTGYSSVMNAMPGGEFRVQNLRRLMNFVSEYEQSTSGGLTGFVRRVRYLQENGNGIKVSDSAPLNAVRIMTIHHSKGLEFPVCILAATNSKGGGDRQRVRCHSELGIGLRTVDTEKLLRFDTVQFMAAKQAASLDEKREELRVLYVALTRPKEKLIVLSTVKVSEKKKSDEDPVADQTEFGCQKYLNKIASMTEYDEVKKQISGEAVLECKTLSDMIVMCALLNGDLKELRAAAGVVDSLKDKTSKNVYLPALSCGTKWKFVRVTDVNTVKEKVLPEENEASDETLLSELHQRFSTFKNDITTRIPTKVTASTLAHNKAGKDIIAVSKPKFDSISSTEKGTAAHAFLQHADFENLYEEISSTDSFEKEKERILHEKRMSEEEMEMLDSKDIKAFVRSELFEKIRHAAAVYREYQFTVRIPAELAFQNSEEFVGEDLSQAETVLQGAVDCIIEEEDGLIIVDYKTDKNTTPEKLISAHGSQLLLYKEAAQKIFEKPIKACVIYSLCLNEAVYL